MNATLMEAGAIPGREQKRTKKNNSTVQWKYYQPLHMHGKSHKKSQIVTKTNKVLTNSNSWSITKHNTWFGKVTKSDRTLPTTIKFGIMAIAGVLRQGHTYFCFKCFKYRKRAKQ